MPTFTYDPTLAADRDRVRFHLQDTEYQSGPKPGDKNFEDAELDGLLVIEGKWERAVAAGLEALAGAWAKHVTFSADGVAASQSNIAAHYRGEAEKWRQRYGFGGLASSGTVGVTRIDGYSSDIPNTETTDAQYHRHPTREDYEAAMLDG